VLREAVAAVDRPALSRLERNFALFTAVGTDRLVELAGTVVIRTGAPAGISLFHILNHADNLHIHNYLPAYIGVSWGSGTGEPGPEWPVRGRDGREPKPAFNVPDSR